MRLPGWDSPKTVSRISGLAELLGVILFAAAILAEVLKQPTTSFVLFGLMVVSEATRFVYGQRDKEASDVALSKLKNGLAPRRVSQAQRDAIASALSGIAPEHVTVFRNKEEQEIAVFAQDIAIAVRQAGWPVRVASKTALGATVVGVHLELNPQTITDKAIPAVNALIVAFQEQGILPGVATANNLLTRMGSNYIANTQPGDLESPIHIVVGEKPQM